MGLSSLATYGLLPGLPTIPEALLDLQMNVSVLEVAPFLMSAQLDQVPPEITGKEFAAIGKWENPQLAGWFIRQNPISMDDLRVALFQETPK